jgi:hypothetical protein
MDMTRRLEHISLQAVIRICDVFIRNRIRTVLRDMDPALFISDFQDGNHKLAFFLRLFAYYL